MKLPDYAAIPASVRFHREIFKEHLDDIAFLYEQRHDHLCRSDHPWHELARLEERIEAHIDALVSGQGLALDVCLRQASTGEPGEAYAALCVFCRQGRRDLIGAALKSFDADDAEKSQAVSDALKDEMPMEWAHALIPGLTRGFEKLIPMLAQYFGHRRLTPGGAFGSLVDRVPPKGLGRMLWGLARVRGDDTVPRLSEYVGHEDAEVRTNAILGWLRRGEPRALAACRDGVLKGDPAMFLPLAVSGGRSDAALLRSLVLTPDVKPEALIALGVLGELGSVQVLVEKLSDEGLAAAAAAALRLITGANLMEDAFIPDVVHEDELFEDELQVFRETGEGPKHADDRPFGVNVVRTSQNSDDWKHWLNEHKSQFDARFRYRLGKPFSLSTLVDTLVSDAFRRQVRTLVSDELAIRYGIDIAFEPDMRVDEQRRQIDAIASVCRERESSFPPGLWHFTGQ